MAAVADPLHQSCDPTTAWSRVNLSEALPGVLTPLGWTFWDHAMEWASRHVFFEMGALPRRELHDATRVDDRFAAVFYGRAAANVRKFSSLVDRIPGTSGAAFEEQLLGSSEPVDAVTDSWDRWSRYPVVAAKLPVAAWRLPARVRALRVQTEPWWRRAVTEHADDALDAAQRRFGEAVEQFRRVMGAHGFATMLGQVTYDQIVQVCPEGSGDLPLRLAGGYGEVAESRVVGDLWRVARKDESMARFLAEHGYHGPDEGEISSRSWREDPGPIEPIVAHYRTMDEDASPEAASRRMVAERTAAESELLARLPRWRRPLARAALAAGRRYIPLREEGKAAYLQAIDVGRMSARRVGSLLADDGALDDPDDVFLLTAAEVRALPTQIGELVAFRRERRRGYEDLAVPDAFRGMPEPRAREPRSDDGAGEAEPITGLGVSSGRYEGRVRVVLDPAECPEFDPGDVLVCPTTDPGWAPLFMVAGALVTDIGGVLSHGAVIARELGIPGVVNTGGATTRLRDGERVVVDGADGTVRRGTVEAP